MKKKRRIEITAFRRRTTIILRERSANNQSAAFDGHNNNAQKALSELASRDLDLDIDQLMQAAQASLAQVEFSESPEIGTKRDLMVKEKESEID